VSEKGLGAMLPDFVQVAPSNRSTKKRPTAMAGRTKSADKADSLIVHANVRS
jgi:hypothetical protein